MVCKNSKQNSQYKCHNDGQNDNDLQDKMSRSIILHVTWLKIHDDYIQQIRLMKLQVELNRILHFPRERLRRDTKLGLQRFLCMKFNLWDKLWPVLVAFGWYCGCDRSFSLHAPRNVLNVWLGFCKWRVIWAKFQVPMVTGVHIEQSKVEQNLYRCSWLKYATVLKNCWQKLTLDVTAQHQADNLL